MGVHIWQENEEDGIAVPLSTAAERLGRHFGLTVGGKFVGHPQGQRIRIPLDELGGAFGGKEPIVPYRDRDTLFQSLNFVGFHGASELLDQGTATVPEFA